jgi:cytochrome b561
MPGFSFRLPRMPAERAADWSPGQRRLHWWSAALVLFAFSLGWLMVAVSTHQLLLKFLLYQLHKSAGLIVLVLVLVRLALRTLRGRPAWDADLPRWQLRAAASVHVLLYLLLAAVPVLGYLTAASAPAGVPTLFLGVIPVPNIIGTDAAWFAVLRPLHRAAAVTLVLLAAAHALAGVHNHWRGRTSLARMSRGVALRPPQACERGSPP